MSNVQPSSSRSRDTGSRLLLRLLLLLLLLLHDG